ncbi:protein of unknown function DUF418 [Beutenbergia cavernae DSM 12333]|uniref:DUF418 domain-containing protein n=1 Tax=Beutenbergia cavernae (strain ATCC BAA-8 / DSM 12333 / CCUG 43141 / JCM 11478 / NBRC 16432 / NCIMB 13614 / HKI 0122) TaxID=471853 RepID=C5BYM2_BEUC1|nr:DUF418 domain-containing protein [Beutenbergia cavernae]ACQ78980.1 protein of unknown function DUF418 [Beutenbergia cavernae DSM 12333]
MTVPDGATTDTSAAPRPDRALAPDLARGVMLALIAVANVGIYLYDRPYGMRQHVLSPEWWDRVASGVVVGAVDSRAYPLFAALFGYGVARIAARASAAGSGGDAEARRRVRRRGLALLVFGAGHALLLFSGDVLGAYGLVSLLLVAFLRSSDKVLLRVAVATAVVTPFVQGVTMADPGPTAERTLFWSVAIADPLEAMAWRAPEWLIGTVGMVGVVPAALIGLWAGRRRILDRPADHRPLLRGWAVGGIAAGLVGGLPAALVVAEVWHPAGATATLVSVLHVATGLLGGLGYAAAIALFSLRRRGRASRLTHALAATGERSLTCYLAQSVVFVALLPAWTLGLGARIWPAASVALALACWGLTVVLAVVLARRGSRGAAETLLRRSYATPSRAVGGSSAPVGAGR